ncbi:MAG: recombinase A, partial [Kofleriaceae bacterium]
VAYTGVDLSALVVVRAPHTPAAARATERLLRSGAFGLVVLDLGSLGNELTMAHQGRLVSLAQAHDAAIVCLTAKPEAASSLGSLVSLRAEALRTRASPAREGFVVTLRGLKDKRRGPGWSHTRKARGPAGL